MGDLFWKRHVDQLRNLAGSTVVDVISRQLDVSPHNSEVSPLEPKVAIPTSDSEISNSLIPESVPADKNEKLWAKTPSLSS